MGPSPTARAARLENVRAADAAQVQALLDALPVERYVPPEEFVELGEIATSMGFRKVASGPLVRSSYHARDMAEDGRVA